MPSNILSADTGFPQFTKETSDKDKIEQITSYLYMLLEQLRYSFCNLDKDNFNETGFDEIVNIITEPVYVQLENDEKQILARRSRQRAWVRGWKMQKETSRL